jgi:hypothetical protein
MRVTLKRSAIAVGALAVVAMLASTIAYTPSRTLHLRTTTGEPVPRAFVAYYYESAVFNFVDSLSRYDPGRLIIADEQGRVEIPARWGIKRWLDSRPESVVAFLYAPQLHNSPPVAAIGATIPGIVDVDPGSGTVTVHDLSGDAERWEGSLRQLFSAVRYQFWPTRERANVIVTRAELEPLVLAVGEEYRALRERHGTTGRWDKEIAQLNRDWAELREAP